MNELLAPDAADNLIKDIEKAILSLENTPERGSQRKTGTYAYKGYRQIFVRNYVIIYKVFPIKKEVQYPSLSEYICSQSILIVFPLRSNISFSHPRSQKVTVYFSTVTFFCFPYGILLSYN